MALFALLLVWLLQDEVQTHFDHALTLIQQHRDEEAMAEFRKTLELKPGLYEADLNLGILLLRNHRAAEALPVLKQAVETKPQEARASMYYAQALLDTGDAAQAERWFATALQIDAKLAAANAGLARALLAEGKLTEAAERFRASGDGPGVAAVAAAYEKRSDAPHALELYREVHDAQSVKRLLLGAADAAVAAKEQGKAADYLQQALQMDPSDYGVHMNYGRMLRDNHKLPEASQQFFAAAKVRPDSAEAWNELASALIVSEKYAEGLGALDRVRALGKEVPGDLYLRAITLDKLKQKPQALAAYRQFLDADQGGHPDQEFLSRQRIRIIESELKK